MKTAKFIKSMDDFRSDARLYRVDPPMVKKSWNDDEPDKKFEYVIVSAVYAHFTGPETFIFGTDEDGKVVDWGELEGSFRGDLDHERALEQAGYSVVDN